MSPFLNDSSNLTRFFELDALNLQMRSLLKRHKVIISDKSAIAGLEMAKGSRCKEEINARLSNRNSGFSRSDNLDISLLG